LAGLLPPVFRAETSILLESLVRPWSIWPPDDFSLTHWSMNAPSSISSIHWTWILRATISGWPVDVNATATYNGITFNSLMQEQRGGLALVNGIVYVAYSGYAGDCGSYHGWVVGVDINDPSSVAAWAATAIGGGIWGYGGVASDGTNMFVVTGNTFNTGGNWMGGEAIIRLQAGPGWTGESTDYWAPTNWLDLDSTDSDLGGISATVIDVPGATPLQLVLALGKDGNAYLVDRNNLGGITALWPKRTSLPAVTEVHQQSHIVRMREHILLFITTRAGRLRLTESARQILP